MDKFQEGDAGNAGVLVSIDDVTANVLDVADVGVIAFVNQVPQDRVPRVEAGDPLRRLSDELSPVIEKLIAAEHPHHANVVTIRVWGNSKESDHHVVIITYGQTRIRCFDSEGKSGEWR